MSVYGSSGGRFEYGLYARVFDTPENFDAYKQRLTDNDHIDDSDCTYQTLWQPEIQNHFKAGLLYAEMGINIKRGHWDMHDLKKSTMFLILCETGIRHYEDRSENPREKPNWVENTSDKMIAGRYIHINWDMNNIFTTAIGKSVQLKVVQQDTGTGARRKAAKRKSEAAALTPRAQLSDMKTLLHQMSLVGAR